VSIPTSDAAIPRLQRPGVLRMLSLGGVFRHEKNSQAVVATHVTGAVTPVCRGTPVTDFNALVALLLNNNHNKTLVRSVVLMLP
jgi:hypothetical protein